MRRTLMLLASVTACAPTMSASDDTSAATVMSCDQQVDALAGAAGTRTPAIGYAPAKMATAVDAVMAKFLGTKGWPGGSISVTYQGKMILARSYGYGDPATGQYAEPDSRFRLASVSKALTGMAVLKAIHDGLLTLDTQPFRFLDVGAPLGTGAFRTDDPGAPYGVSTGISPNPPGDESAEVILGAGGKNPLLDEITIRDLLYHAGGWGRTTVDDPGMPGMIQPISRALGIDGPASAKQMIRFMLDQPLQFKPGTSEDYSNLGYWVLGETLAELAGPGSSYEDYLRATILDPLGMHDTTEGRTLASERQDREVSYFSYDSFGVPSASGSWVYGGAPLPAADGGWMYVEGFTGGGSLISSATDLARFNSAIRDHKLAGIFPPMSTGTWPGQFYSMTSSELSVEKNAGTTSCWTGMGWDVVACGGKVFNWAKGGGLPGTTTEILLTDDGYGLTALFNASIDSATGISIDSLLWKIHDAVVSNLPASTVDLFPQYEAPYTTWQTATAFEATLAAAAARGQTVSRVDGRWVPLMNDHCLPGVTCRATPAHEEYRARLAPIATTIPKVLVNQTCSEAASAMRAGGEVVSLQKFVDDGEWRYQLVLAAAPSP
jgi:N-acyl-D-amino-acid deacylase